MILKGVLRLFVSLYLYGKHNYKYISKVYLKHILQIYLICLLPAVVAPIRALRGGIYCTFLLIYTRSIRPDRRAVYCLDKLSAIASNSISMRNRIAKRLLNIFSTWHQFYPIIEIQGRIVETNFIHDTLAPG